MQSTCIYSGLPIYKTPYLLGMELADLHPIFRARRKHILTPDMVHKFAKATSFEEKKLIHLAVLNATELVEFQHPAMPSLQTVEKTFYKLIHTAGWLAFAEHTYKQIVGFPRFVINKDTCDLTSLIAWINACEDIKDQVIRKDIDRDRAAALTNKENEIRKELGDAAFYNRAFTPNLARWALDFAGMPRNNTDYHQWVKIMCSPLADAWVYEIDTLRDIEAYLEDNLPYDHPQVISVMAQVRLLIAECKKGFTEFAVFSESDPEGETFSIVHEDSGETTLSKHLEDIPTSEPQRKDFAKGVDFLVAQAKWKLAHREVTQSRPVRKLVTPNPQANLNEDSV